MDIASREVAPFDSRSDAEIRAEHIRLYGSHYALHVTTDEWHLACEPCVRDINEQEQRWAALDASVPCSHSIPGICDRC
jgi:hypothetical protein